MNDSAPILFLPQITDGEDKSSPFKNRIRKNYRHVRKWAKRTATDCFRIYDRDIKAYPVAIDFYANNFLVHYFSYDYETDEIPEDLVQEVETALTSIFSITAATIFARTRIRRKMTEQYEKIATEKQFLCVHEYGVKFYVNLHDYLDTGLFLDHRETRQLVAKNAHNKRVLNLFAYTSSFSVHAALKGACFTKSVDLSNTYVAWSQENFKLNNLSLKNNEVVRDDCLKFLDSEIKSKKIYDIIIIDPPTLSRSKKMDQFFDIQEEYVTLIQKACRLLSRDGTIFFSTNSRKFRFDTALFPAYYIQEITQKTIPLDFHNQKIHQVWQIKQIL